MPLQEIYLSNRRRQIQFDPSNSNAFKTNCLSRLLIERQTVQTSDNKWQRITTSDNEWQRVTRGDKSDNEWQQAIISANFPFFWIIWCWCGYLKNEKVTLSTFLKLPIWNIIHHFVTVNLLPTLNNCWQIDWS